LASDSEQPEIETAFEDLQKLVHHLGDELASFRRRALQAEARVKALEATPGATRASPERIGKLEKENASLRVRLETARSRTRQMLDRVRFLRQQHETASR
jgi:predicted  nucleic acid-binding Zn-ribbon protein